MDTGQGAENSMSSPNITQVAKAAGRDVGAAATDALAALSVTAQDVGKQVKDVASSLTSEANERVQSLMNQNVGAGVELIGHVAGSMRTAAGELRQNAPQLAGFVGQAADKVDEFSASIRGKSVGELFNTASDFARRKPVVVFGAAAACGFFLSRILKADSSGNGSVSQQSHPMGNNQSRPDNATAQGRSFGGEAGSMSRPASSGPGSSSHPSYPQRGV
jgi:hypothetical protein